MAETNQPTGTTRRAFIGQAAATATAIAVTHQAQADAPPPPKRRPWKKAIMFGMLKAEGSLANQFQLLKDCGFDGAELNAPGQFNVNEVTEACKRTGFLVEGTVDAFHWQVNMADPDPKIRAAAVEHLKGAIRECKSFGGTSVLLVPAVVNKRVTYDDAWKRSIEEIRKAVPTAEETGVKIAIENVWNQFLLSPLEAARYVDEFNSPMVGWHFDIGNVINYGWPEQWAHILGKRIVKLHIKEFSRKKRDEEGLRKGFNVELLEGDNDWPAVMKALDDVGYNTWACAEVPGGGAARMKEVATKMDQILALAMP